VCLQELKFNQGNYPVLDNIADNHGLQETEHESVILLMKVKEKMDILCRQIIDIRFGIDQKISPDEANLGHHHNLKFEEIGKILGIEPDNARQRFKRCMEKLREMLFNNPVWIENLDSK
jgi:DNA-directed RNA polymerase specialized sigma subunit